jgi:hypothetical protein
MLTEYTAMLALPFGDMAADAAARIPGATYIDNEDAGVWVVWTATAETDKEGIHAIQELRLRAEMDASFLNGGTTASGSDPSLFQSTPFLIIRGDAVIIHSEEVVCI